MKPQAESGNVSRPSRQRRACVFIREEQKSLTEAKDNKRSACVKHQQVHVRFTCQVFPCRGLSGGRRDTWRLSSFRVPQLIPGIPPSGVETHQSRTGWPELKFWHKSEERDACYKNKITSPLAPWLSFVKWKQKVLNPIFHSEIATNPLIAFSLKKKSFGMLMWTLLDAAPNYTYI